MRKILALVLAFCFVSSLAFGWGGGDPQSANATPWKSYTVTNTSGVYLLTNVAVTIIPKKSSILGYKIMPVNSHSENVCTIYDGGVTSSDEVIGEAECAPESWDGEWYPYPRTLEKQIYIHQGPNTKVTIFFE